MKRLPILRRLQKLLRLGFTSPRQRSDALLLTLLVGASGSALLYGHAVKQQKTFAQAMGELIRSELRQQQAELRQNARLLSWSFADWLQLHPGKSISQFWEEHANAADVDLTAVLLQPGQPPRLLRASERTGTPPPTSRQAALLETIHTTPLLQWGNRVVLAEAVQLRLADGSTAQLIQLEPIRDLIAQLEAVLRQSPGSATTPQVELSLHWRGSPAEQRGQRDALLDHEQEQEQEPSWLPLLNSGQVLDLPTPFKNRGEPQQDLVVHFLNRPDQRLLWLQQWGAFLLISAAILLVISGQRIQLGLRDRSNQLRQRQQQRQQQQQQRHSQRRDPLTGQLSEQGLLEGMAEQQRRYPGFHQAVLVVDLDRFSLINSALGRSQADQLLVQMGEQLVKQLPASSLVARLEADRFAAALLSTSDRSLSSEITAISAAMSRFELSLASQPILLTAHCGAMHLTAHQSSLANAVEQAGYSCDQAKRNQTRLVVHAPQPGAEDPFTNLQNLHQELNRALRRGSVIAYGQPAWRHSPQGWQPAYVELLCRLVDPEGGKHYWREEFAQAAQFWGTATSFDQHMLDNMGQAVEALQQHGGGLPADLTVAVNITPGSLAQPGFDQQIAELIELYGLPAEQLCLEITEQAAIADLSNTRQLLTRLKRLGVKVALDDFGAGMTSLSQLQELPLDFVKVDRRFVMHLLMPTTSASHRCSEAVVRFLVELGRELGFEVIAEGVEQASLIAPLQAMGVDLLQGYLFGQPAPLRSLDLQAPLQLPTSEPTQVA